MRSFFIWVVIVRKQILIPLLLYLLLLAVCIGTQLPDRIESLLTETPYEAPTGPYAVVTVGDKTCEPYFNWLSSTSWSGQGMAAADTFNYLPRNLPTIEDKLPTVVYNNDLVITYRSDVTGRYVYVYDEEYQNVEFSGDFADLSSLPNGRYFVAISTVIQGRYVHRAKMHESVGGDLVFVLDKH